VALAILALPCTARAQHAGYASPDDLRREGIPHAIDVAALGTYSRVATSAKSGRLENASDFRLRSRLGVGRSLAYFAGIDGEVGGSDAGVVYGVTGYLLGFGTRWGAGNALSLSGGVGLDRVGSVPLAAKFPVELSIALSVGPVRPILWVRPAWIADEPLRRKGSTLSFVDEIDTGLLVRLGKQHRYWSTTSAGGGLSLGVGFREFMQTHAVTALLGFEFEGER
jgi:hypothetical protein